VSAVPLGPGGRAVSAVPGGAGERGPCPLLFLFLLLLFLLRRGSRQQHSTNIPTPPVQDVRKPHLINTHHTFPREVSIQKEGARRTYTSRGKGGDERGKTPTGTKGDVCLSDLSLHEGLTARTGAKASTANLTRGEEQRGPPDQGRRTSPWTGACQLLPVRGGLPASARGTAD
jgi:hypothetical protein